MRLYSRPCIPTMLSFLMLLQLAFKVSLQEGIAPNGEDPRREVTLQELKLQMKELQNQMDDLRTIFNNTDKILLGPGGAIVGDKIFKRLGQKSILKGANYTCDYKVALPRNAAENRVLKDILHWHNEQAVLGTIYNKDEKMFVDMDGHPLEFFNWAPGEPHNLPKETCVLMYPDGYWHNVECEYFIWSIICEFDVKQTVYDLTG